MRGITFFGAIMGIALSSAGVGRAGEVQQLLGPDAKALGELIAVAVSSYPSIVAARSEVKAARADLSGARWQRAPSVVVESTGSARRNNDVDLAVSVEQPLWTGGRISGGIRQGKAGLAAAEAKVDEMQLEITLRVVAAYFETQRLQAREGVLKDSLDEHRKLVESMERRVAQELSAMSDLSLARSRMSQVEQDMAATSGARRAALARLRELTGLLDYQLAVEIGYLPGLHHPNAANIQEEALAFDPRRRRLIAEADVAAANVDIRQASILPQVNFRYLKQGNGADEVGVVVRAQTDGGLSRLSSVDAARERRAAAELQIMTGARELREAMEADLMENSTARTRVSSSSEAASSAQMVTDSFMRQFIAGKRTWFDVMNAVRESVAARLSAADARTSAIASASRLLLRSGRWRPADEKPE